MLKVNLKKDTQIYEEIPCWNNGKWELVSYESRKEFLKDLEDNYFKEPGEYELDDIIDEFRSQAKLFDERGYYCDWDDGTIPFYDYWDWEKYKSLKGVFFWTADGRKYYLPGDYYFWINFLPIYDKVLKKDKFPSIWDTQIWLALYEFMAELNYEMAVVLKKRQFGSSFLHVARLIKKLWFLQSAVLKIGASLDAYITGTNGSWKYAQKYRTFLNKHTAWTRPMNPHGAGDWMQKQEVTENGVKYDIGNFSTLQGVSFHQSDTAGVGGATTEFFYEEAGIAPTMDKTYEFMLPAMKAGDITTGFFVAAGTVGDLKDCKPLKKFMSKPEAHGFRPIRNKWANNRGTVQMTGMFIPEQYSMEPFIDKYGNSLVEQALIRLKEIYKQWEDNLDIEQAQIKKSQHPMNMEIAFDSREESRFPQALVKSHKLDIQEGKYPKEVLEIDEAVDGKIVVERCKRSPIMDFPVDRKMADKRGALVVWERPDGWDTGSQPKWGTYYASVDPVRDGKTTSSDSLCSIHVYKNPIQVTRYDDRGRATTHIEGDKVVAAWAGRYDDINDTHKQLERIIRWYNAWTLVENNVSLFILHMIHHRLQKYLVPKSEMVFLKEHGHNKGSFQEFGWRNTGRMFQDNLLPYLIESLKEKIYEETDDNGNVIKVIYGISRIPDEMACEEMLAYEPGMNVDRLIDLSALIAFVKLQNANKGYLKRIEEDGTQPFEKSDKISKLNKRSPFKHIGTSPQNGSGRRRPPRNPFKHIG